MYRAAYMLGVYRQLRKGINVCVFVQVLRGRYKVTDTVAATDTFVTDITLYLRVINKRHDMP